MKPLLTLFFILCSFSAQSQFFKEFYKDFLKYGTIYTVGNISNSYETTRKDYFVRPLLDGQGLYEIPELVDNTQYFPFDYTLGIGIRKLARFDYEIKGKHFYDGTENNKALSSPTAAVKGFEYLFHWERERERGEIFTNLRYFIRHTGKNHIVKFESREEGNIGFKYKSAEVRARLPIGKKLSISAGAILRTHEQPFGYNPVEIWLNELKEDGKIANYWFELGFEYGYDDIFYTSEYVDPVTQETKTTYNWFWIDPEGVIVSYTDEDFRETIFPSLMNRYNNEIWDELDGYVEISPIVGADLYHYSDVFWVHGYVNYLLPYHHYIKGDKDFSYLNRNNWGRGGLIEDKDPEQWDDYQAGLIFGWKLTNALGVFVEGEYTKFWDSKIFNTVVGINLKL